MIKDNKTSVTKKGRNDDVESQVMLAGQWQLMWRRFRRHRVAIVGEIVIIIFYMVILGAGFLSYSDPNATEAYRSLIPPQRIHFFDNGRWRPHVYALERKRDPKTFELTYKANPEKKIPVRFFVHGFEYKFWGLITTDLHLIGVEGAKAEETLFLLGTDTLGRDLWSRVVYGTRTSLTIGMVGVAFSFFLGILFGGISGFFGGSVDTFIQRIIEIFLCIPTIPLWLGLAAAMPGEWGIVKVYFAITIILSLMGWPSLAREVRGKFLSLRENDFVIAAKIAGASQIRIAFRHIFPSMLSHIIAALTLALPAMIIGETALSFLGLGLRPPAISWGVLLQQAQNIQAIAITPWLLIPAIPVIVSILAFNFLGDGLRDAADPYGKIL